MVPQVFLGALFFGVHEYRQTHPFARALFLAVASALCAVLVTGLLLGLGRLAGLPTDEEWAHSASPARRREHRWAVALGMLLLAGGVALLLRS